ncbi:MAG: ParA family protein [Oligoflexia bacterium]|nr:ParA family protein [Oligoflexia bacterium]
MGKVLAIANQKGGVGKTTSSVSIAAELAMAGRRVLLVDFDPQGSATSGLGVSLSPEDAEDLYDVFLGKVSLSNIIRPTQIPLLSIAPASPDLVSIEVEVGRAPGRELILKSELNLLKVTFDYVIIDCPPSSGLLTLNALGAADSILIPLQAEYYALEGLSSLMKTVEFVQHTFNPGLEVLGVFMTMFDARTNLSNQVEAEARKFFADKMFSTRIPRNIKLSECPSHGVPICVYDKDSAGAVAYKSLAREIDARCMTAVEMVVANG